MPIRFLAFGAPTRSIRYWLGWLVGVCSLPALVVSGYLIATSYASGRASVERDRVATARALMQAIDATLHGAQVSLQVLGASPYLRSDDMAAFHEMAREVLKELPGNAIVLADTTGQQLINTLERYGQPLPQISVPSQVRDVFASKRPAVSDFYVGAVSKLPQVAIGVPVLRDGEVAYTLIMGVLPTSLAQILENQKFPESWIVTILDSSGTVVARTENPEQFVGQKATAEFQRQTSKAQAGIYKTSTRDLTGAYSRSPVTGWMIAVGIPTDIVMADVRHQFIVQIAAAVILLSMSALLAKHIYARITRSICAMSASALALGSFKNVEVPHVEIEEVNALGQALARASQLIQERVRERDESDSYARSILQTSPDAVITIDEQGAIQTFSETAEKLFGYTAEEATGQNVNILMPSPHRENHDGYLDRFRRNGERHMIGIRRQLNARRKDGHLFPMELTIGEFNAGGRRTFTGFVHDITARLKMEENLYRSRQMEALGQMTGSVAHDFGNLLMPIQLGLTSLLRHPNHPQFQRRVENALASTERASTLVRSLLAFARQLPLDITVMDISDLIQGMKNLLALSLGSDAQLVLELELEIWPVEADPSRMEQAILNLVVNARDAMTEHGAVRISTSNVSLHGEHDGLVGDYVAIMVMDTGSGMPPEVLARAFEPLFTTKAPGEGTGLGLASVYGFAKQCHGITVIDSEMGKGTTVTIYLPRTIKRDLSGSETAAA